MHLVFQFQTLLRTATRDALTPLLREVSSGTPGIIVV